MNRSLLNVRSVAVVGAFALALLTAGCGSSDDSSAPSSSVGSTTTGTLPSATGATSDGDGSASDDLVSWAGDFCGAVGPMIRQMQDFTTAPTDASDPAALVAQYQDLLAQVGPALASASTAIAALDAPPVENGADLQNQMVTLLQQSSAAFSQIADQIADLDPSDPNAFASVGSAFQELEPDLEKSSDALDKAFSDVNMKDAFDQAPECAGLDMGS